MLEDVAAGISVPFIGTVSGAACVFFLKKNLNSMINKILAGFAAGVMTAASIWSLIIPALEQKPASKLNFIPVLIGFWTGIFFLLAADIFITYISSGKKIPVCCKKSRKKETSMLILAVTIHNIPEGMAVGIVYSGLLSGNENITAAGAFVLALGIAVQNFPEGAIISMPLRADGEGKLKAFLFGVISAVVETLGALLTIFASEIFINVMPYMLSFAAGAMFYVVVGELIPEASAKHSGKSGIISFSSGFSVMMALDVLLG